MENVRCDGSNICYSDQGKGEVIVLLHGFCGSAEYWEKVIPGLAAQYRVIAPDLRGHGSSDAPLGAYTIEQMADDVLALLNALEIPECYLLGHSLGGYITLSFAQRHASRLKGFGLIHSSGYPDSEEAKENRLKSIGTIQNAGIFAFVDELIPGLFAPNAAQQLQERAKEIGYKTPPQGAVGAAMAMRERLDRRDVISATALPVLLVAGAEDSKVSAERTFTSDNPNITKVTISGVGHMSMFEAPEHLSQIIKEFVHAPVQD
ncbi:alpha/beta fold hydrolase [Paenibacillus sp. MMS20-IR301]|uniref:alpha/beta fold hydrolase n=1 Tax=Paenibacillus sp. MMS20-IR301 TaxID=2895946 RepID=UPI0028EB4314|nr:alpha/beta fold hydrolase [Paenibacillus sp. MMS20-IR301]WNS42991.1 alpha/beta fold hydrolase [Paenibacillus sp. MMS20-IR301]